MLYKGQIHYPNYPTDSHYDLKRLGYLDLWIFIFSNDCYKYLLYDYSLLAFINQDEKYSYYYFEGPFLDSFLDDYTDENINRVIDSYLKDPEELDFTIFKQLLTPLRYDFDPQCYHQAHPMSHLHFGYRNNIRVGADRFLTPYAFLLLIIRQCYPFEWIELLNDPKFSQWCRDIRDNRFTLPSESLDFLNELILR